MTRFESNDFMKKPKLRITSKEHLKRIVEIVHFRLHNISVKVDDDSKNDKRRKTSKCEGNIEII